MDQSVTECRSRVVLLGASNVERSLATIVRIARSGLPGPIEWFIACGHGRSYGAESSVLGRRLPGIAPCELWDALAARPPLPTYALVTDVGNDLLYGAPVEAIVAWVDACVERLRACDARVVIAGLPLGALAQLPRWRFAMLSRVFFPLHGAQFETTLARAHELDTALREIVARHAAQWISPPSEWYGFDPIHIRKGVWNVAWGKIFLPWNFSAQARESMSRVTFGEWLRLKRMRPAQRQLWGVAQRQQQPADRWADDSSYWLY
jgi:hypothetical protein